MGDAARRSCEHVRVAHRSRTSLDQRVVDVRADDLVADGLAHLEGGARDAVEAVAGARVGAAARCPARPGPPLDERPACRACLDPADGLAELRSRARDAPERAVQVRARAADRDPRAAVPSLGQRPRRPRRVTWLPTASQKRVDAQATPFRRSIAPGLRLAAIAPACAVPALDERAVQSAWRPTRRRRCRRTGTRRPRRAGRWLRSPRFLLDGEASSDGRSIARPACAASCGRHRCQPPCRSAKRCRTRRSSVSDDPGLTPGDRRPGASVPPLDRASVCDVPSPCSRRPCRTSRSGTTRRRGSSTSRLGLTLGDVGQRTPFQCSASVLSTAGAT